MPEPIRVQKALADAGVASRRGADALVAAGRVTVNGQPAVTGQRVDPSVDALAVDGRPIVPPGRRTYLVLNKPVGVTSTVSDRHAEQTVLDLVPDELLRPGTRLYPVGRLDKDSEGLILLTDDGEWAQHLLHPRYGVEREYAVGLRHPLDAARTRALHEGIELDEGLARLSSLRQSTRTEAARLEGGDDPVPRCTGIAPSSRRAGSASCGGCSQPSTPRWSDWSACASAPCASTPWPPAASAG